jgi:hypothetical protein
MPGDQPIRSHLDPVSIVVSHTGTPARATKRTTRCSALAGDNLREPRWDLTSNSAEV